MKFQPGVPFESGKPSVVVDAGLAAGTHRFQLVVFNERGQRSAPVTVAVIVDLPTTRIPPVDVVVEPPPIRPVDPIIRIPVEPPITRIPRSRRRP